MVTIRVLSVVDGHVVDADDESDVESPRQQIVARAYLPTNQEFMTSPIRPASERVSAIRSLVSWLARHRPQWDFEIDDSHGSTAVVS